MRKSRLSAGILGLFSATAFAAATNQPGYGISPGSSTNPTGQPSATQSPEPAINKSTPATVPATNTTPLTTPTAPATQAPVPTPAVNPATPAAPAAPATPATPAIPKTSQVNKPLDCNYRIPAETTNIEPAIVQKWAEKAAVQSFDLDHNTLDKQLSDLKACYTDLGWQGFNDALQKSGNLNAIKTQQLTVSSMLNGEAKVIEAKDNQWKLTIPLQVVYQNDKEKLSQPLTVNLVVGRKISGDLGIMQMIAIPQQTAPANDRNKPAVETAPQ